MQQGNEFIASGQPTTTPAQPAVPVAERPQKTKSGKVSKVLCVVFALIATGLGGYICYDKLVAKSDVAEKTELSEEGLADGAKDADELTIVSNGEINPLVKSDLNAKVALILEGRMSVFSEEKYFENGGGGNIPIFYTLASGASLTDDEKRSVVLSSYSTSRTMKSRWDYAKGGQVQKLFESGKYDSNNPGNDYRFQIIDAKEVADTYKSLFGEEIKHKNQQVDYACEEFLYEQDAEVYVVDRAQCGGTSSDVVSYYVYDYATNESEAHVKVAAAYLVDSEGVYTSAEFQKIENNGGFYYAWTGVGEIYSNDVENFWLDESNYKDFESYDFVFKQKDGVFSFDHVEKMSQS